MDKYFASLVEKHAQETPDRIAIIDADGATKTWKEFSEDVTRVSNSLLALGLKKGDRIATIMYQGIGYHSILMAAATIGLVVVGLDHRFTIQEAAGLCKRTLPKLIIAKDYALDELLGEVDIPHVYTYQYEINHPKALSYEKLLQGSLNPIPEELHPSVKDPLIIIFTSGTTGQPKGGLITHENTWHMSKNSCDSWEFTNDDRVMCYLPVSHVGGVHDQITMAVYSGATSVCMPRFDPNQLMGIIDKYKVSYLGFVPTIFRLLMLKIDFTKYDTTSVRCLVLSGEAVSEGLVNSVNKYFPNAKVASSWGMTETAGFFTLTLLSDSMQVIAATEGAARGNNIMKALKGDETWAGPEEIGELCITGPQVIPGYMDEKDNSGTFFEKDGAIWMKTGDLGRIGKENYMYFSGRTKEMYISGGYNVYPPEIEAFLGNHPLVNAVAVIGVADEVWGEKGYAFVIPEEGVQVDEKTLAQYCKDGLANYKRPSRIIINKELPKTPIGKIEKKTIANNIEKYTGAE